MQAPVIYCRCWERSSTSEELARFMGTDTVTDMKANRISLGPSSPYSWGTCREYDHLCSTSAFVRTGLFCRLLAKHTALTACVSVRGNGLWAQTSSSSSSHSCTCSSCWLHVENSRRVSFAFPPSSKYKTGRNENYTCAFLCLCSSCVIRLISINPYTPTITSRDDVSGSLGAVLWIIL